LLASENGEQPAHAQWQQQGLEWIPSLKMDTLSIHFLQVPTDSKPEESFHQQMSMIDNPAKPHQNPFQINCTVDVKCNKAVFVPSSRYENIKLATLAFLASAEHY
jgi:hypothetical protein